MGGFPTWVCVCYWDNQTAFWLVQFVFSKVKRAMGRTAVSHTSHTARPQHMTTAFTTYLSDHGVTTHLTTLHTAVYNPSLEPFPLCCDRNPTI